MFAYYTYKPSLKGILCKQPSVRELLIQHYRVQDGSEDEGLEIVAAYIDAHRRLVHRYPHLNPALIKPRLKGQAMVEPSPQELVLEHLLHSKGSERAAQRVTEYFGCVTHCFISSPSLKPFGGPTQSEKSPYHDYSPQLPGINAAIPSVRELYRLHAERRQSGNEVELTEQFIKAHEQLINRHPDLDPFEMCVSDPLDGQPLSPRALVQAYLLKVCSDAEAERLTQLYSHDLNAYSDKDLYSVVIKRLGFPMKVHVAVGLSAANTLAEQARSNSKGLKYAHVIAVSTY